MSDGADGESELVASLRGMADAAGEEIGSAWTIVHQGCRIAVFYSGGSSSFLRLSVPFDQLKNVALEPVVQHGYRDAAAPTRPIRAPRPLAIELRREMAWDVGDKTSGINREAQTGDKVFDDAVYIDSPAEEAVIRAVLATKAAREAVMDLLDLGFSKVVIDDDAMLVTAQTSFTSHRTRVENRGQKAIAAFARLILAVPRVQAGGARERDPWSGRLILAGTLALVGLFGGVPIYMAFAPPDCVVSGSDGDGWTLECSIANCCDPGAHGIMLGLVVAPLAAYLMARAARSAIAGRSNSASQYRALLWITALLALEATVALTTLWSWR